MLGLFLGLRWWQIMRRHISEHGWRRGSGVEVLRDALALVDGAAVKAA